MYLVVAINLGNDIHWRRNGIDYSNDGVGGGGGAFHQEVLCFVLHNGINGSMEIR